MSDFEFFEATVTRTGLGLNPLPINDRINYILGDQIMGGTQTWSRQSVRSPYVDGEFTVNRTRGRVEETFQVQCLGTSQQHMKENMAELIAAFSQPRFSMIIEMDDAVYAWDCEASDYTIEWLHTRFMAKQVLVTFQLMRQPKMLNGGW